MTNDQQQAEDEFHKFWDEQCDKGYKDAYEVARNAWFEAKRKQPVIELPKSIVLTLALGDTVPLLTKDDVIDSITAAGYSYKAK